MIAATLLLIAGLILPLGYLAACVWLYRQKVWWFTYLSYFCLFGAVGGWAFAFALSPSGLTAMSIVFLVTVVLAACLISSIVLTFRKQKKQEEKWAMIGGYFYPLFLGIVLCIGRLLG